MQLIAGIFAIAIELQLEASNCAFKVDPYRGVKIQIGITSKLRPTFGRQTCHFWAVLFLISVIFLVHLSMALSNPILLEVSVISVKYFFIPFHSHPSNILFH